MKLLICFQVSHPSSLWPDNFLNSIGPLIQSIPVPSSMPFHLAFRRLPPSFAQQPLELIIQEFLAKKMPNLHVSFNTYESHQRTLFPGLAMEGILTSYPKDLDALEDERGYQHLLPLSLPRRNQDSVLPIYPHSSHTSSEDPVY